MLISSGVFSIADLNYLLRSIYVNRLQLACTWIFLNMWKLIFLNKVTVRILILESEKQYFYKIKEAVLIEFGMNHFDTYENNKDKQEVWKYFEFQINVWFYLLAMFDRIVSYYKLIYLLTRILATLNSVSL